MKGISLHKFEEHVVNEDAVLCDGKRIAVSDGAGGGGVYADRWSAYLLENLPFEPIGSAEELDEWIGKIWERFYNGCEEEAKKKGGVLLDKFYDEGSFATLVAVWKTDKYRFYWMSYGDSVAFHYNRRTKKLEHSFTRLGDFDRPPYLINCKDELNRNGFRGGVFAGDADSVVFVASDALSHYILMMYEVSRKGIYAKELQDASGEYSKNGNLVRTACRVGKFDFERDVLKKLLRCSGHGRDMKSHLLSLLRKGLLAHDDYSFAWM